MTKHPVPFCLLLGVGIGAALFTLATLIKHPTTHHALVAYSWGGILTFKSLSAIFGDNGPCGNLVYSIPTVAAGLLTWPVNGVLMGAVYHFLTYRRRMIRRRNPAQ